MKFAIIKTGGKQYKVADKQKLKIEKITGDYKVGDKVTFDQVLMTIDGDKAFVGSPLVTGAKVEAEITDIAKHDTVTVVKYKQKSRYHKKNGHRQPYFEVTVSSIA